MSPQVGPASLAGTQIIYNSRYYGIGIFCFDVATGNLVWKNTDNQQGGEIRLVGNRLLFAPGAGLGYAFDTATGKVVYNFDASNTSSLVELNGIVYYVDSDLRLHAVEVSSGKELWKIDSPDYLADKSTSYWKFATEIGVVPGQNGQKGRILVHTYLNAYAYEAIR